jgi:Neuraminidase (sialidase)
MKQYHIKNTATMVTTTMIAVFGTLATANAQIGYQPVSILQTNGKNDNEGDFRPVLASDRGNTIVATWHSRENLNGAGTDFDIFAAKSEDGGSTWTNPVVVNSNGVADSQGDLRPDIATNAAGTWIVCWESTDSLGGTGTDADIFISRSVDNGSTWTPALPVNDAINDSGRDMNPGIATDANGTWVIVWDVSAANGNQSVLMSRSIDEGLNWSAPVDLTTGFPGGSFLPDVASDGNGNWLVGYATESERSNIGIVRSSDRGATWSQPERLHAVEAEEGQDFEVAIKSDGMGTWIAAWESGNALGASIGSDQDILFSRSIDQGQTWTLPAALNRNAGDDGDATDQGVSLASPAPGKWVAVWTSEASFFDSIGDDNDVLTAVSIDGVH